MRKVFFVLFALILFAPLAHAQTIYYIDYAGGSNSNAGTSTGAAWKSIPGMQQGAGCGGATHSYMHHAGDHFIFKGGTGETWPAACFVWTISNSGTLANPDYYGVDKTWYNGGSWTRPKFDLAKTVPSGNNVIKSVSTTYITLDNFEIANQGISGSTSPQCSPNVGGTGSTGQAAIVFTGGAGIEVENMYIHGWMTTSSGGYDFLRYSAGTLYGVTLAVNNILDGSETTYGPSNTPITFGGAIEELSGNSNSEAYGNTIHDTMAAMFSVRKDHDNVIYNVSARHVLLDSCPHSQVIESDDSAPDTIYNNLVYSNHYTGGSPAQRNVGVVIYECAATTIYNNVMYDNNQSGSNGDIMIGDAQFCANGGTGGTVNIYNNTIDCSNGVPCFQTDAKGTLNETVNLNNNLFITNGNPIFLQSSITTFNNGPNNRTNTTAQAALYGETSANKYKLASSDPNVVAKGANLTSSCSAKLVLLCQDASGAPWSGGSYIARPTGSTAWDLGAYVFSGGATGPPVVSWTSPSAGPQSGTLTLTVTATPQGAATIASVQFYIDGFAFGAPDTSFPYSTTWVTNTASNARAHILTAVATDSNLQTGSAAPLSVTPTNTHANGFVSDNLWAPNIPNQPITPITTGTVTRPVCITPYTATNNNNEAGLSNALPTGYPDFSTIISIQPPGYITFYKPGTGYTTDAGATAYPATPGTQYCFDWAIDMTNQKSWLAETSPTPVTIVASPGYAFRAAAASLNYLSAYATNNSTPDTIEVANFSTPAVPTLSFSPGDLSFPNTVATMTSTLTDSVTIANPNATISSAVVAGTGFALDGSSTCPNPSGTLSVACGWTVTFTPPSAGNYSGTFTITGNQSASPQVFNLTGTGVAATPAISANYSSLDFGNIRLANPPVIATTGPITVNIINPSATFTSVVVSGGDAADFGLAANACTGTVSISTCSITPKFTPSKIGTESTDLIITSSDATGSPITVHLTAAGVSPAPPVAPGAAILMGSLQKLFQVPLSINGLSLGSVPFSAKIDFTCTECNVDKGTCGSCVAQ